jgi:hypothetical protein
MEHSIPLTLQRSKQGRLEETRVQNLPSALVLNAAFSASLDEDLERGGKMRHYKSFAGATLAPSRMDPLFHELEVFFTLINSNSNSIFRAIKSTVQLDGGVDQL